MSRFGKVAVLMGGRSAEREISLKSGNMVLHALKKKGVDAHAFDPRDHRLEQLIARKFDRVFIALHGRFGEDGTVQGALEYLGIPYTGSGVMASALAMDKWRTKLLWRAAGIVTPPYELLSKDGDFAGVAARLGLPLMVKPAREGSSIGMSKVTSVEKIPPAFERAAQYDSVIIAERFIEGIELTAGILGDQPLPLIRLETPRVFYDYEAKYFADDTRYICPCGLPEIEERRVQEQALAAFRLLGCSGWGRVDLMLDQGGDPYLLEVNTIPGMTDHSLVPMAARAQGISFEDLVVRILESAHVG
ncbi:MAG: D-alanine--D-alanine ligase [Betaproteobacteria bacterium RIFCSPLOWO2_12_FULL_62_13]|nr:MAG: D-alanine--D-alanine ligase [Betaproteobacteria bacterium RIFCSPLOWO2_12_FULL_62_13]